MTSVRNELALANAQELINVRAQKRNIPSFPLRVSHPPPPPPRSYTNVSPYATTHRSLSHSFVLGRSLQNFHTHKKQKTNEKCYAKCVTKPSTSLSSSEEVRRLIQNLISHFHCVVPNPNQKKKKKSKFYFIISFRV
jgi:Tim10/DDP family zinc finger